jgi:hypothetical protein
MTALLRYQAALLLRTYRWLPPLVLYVVLLGVGLSAGQPVLDSLGLAAAALLPAAVWLARGGLTAEPPAARACVAAAAGPGRAQLAAAAVALAATTLLGATGVAVVAAFGDRHTNDGRHLVALGPALADGLLTVLVCALLGTAIGVLAAPPMLRRPGWASMAGAAGALLVLVTTGSPANAAVRGLVGGSNTGHVALPLWQLGAAALVWAAVVGWSARRAGRG